MVLIWGGEREMLSSGTWGPEKSPKTGHAKALRSIGAARAEPWQRISPSLEGCLRSDEMRQPAWTTPTV